MKITIGISALLFVSIAFPAFGEECKVKVIAEEHKVYVAPVYEAQVQYIFNDSEKKAFATLQWKLSEDRTLKCREQALINNPSNTILFSKVRLNELHASMFGTNKISKLPIFETAPYVFSSSMLYFELDFTKKNEILTRIENNEPLISITGEFSYIYFKASKAIKEEYSPLGSVDIKVFNNDAEF